MQSLPLGIQRNCLPRGVQRKVFREASREKSSARRPEKLSSARRPEKSLPRGVQRKVFREASRETVFREASREKSSARRPGGFAIRRKKKVRPMKTGGFVIPHNSPSITKRLPHNNHFQQSPTPCIIYRRTIKIILRIPHELGSHRILMNIIQLLLEKLER